MGIQLVKKGQPLTAAAWNQMANEINNNLAGSSHVWETRSVPCTIANRTEIAKKAGELLTVYKGGCQRLAAYSPDDARLAWMNNGFQLDGWGSGSGGVPALLLEGVDEGGAIGRCLVPGLCAGFITVSGSTVPDTCKFTGSAFVELSSGDTADWKIIASSSVVSGRAFVYVTPFSGVYASENAVTDISKKYYQTALAWSQANHNGTVVISESTYSLNEANADQAGISFVSDVYCDEYGEMHVVKAKLQLSKTNGTTAVLSLNNTVVNTQPSGVTLPVCDINLTKKSFLRPTGD